MLAEGRVVGIARVREGVTVVETPARVDADLLGPGRGGDVQLGAERDLEAGRDDSRVRSRVVQHGPIAASRQEERPALAVGREVARERTAQLRVGLEGGRRVAVGRHEEVEGVAGDNERARPLGHFEQVGELDRGAAGRLGPCWAQEEVAHHDHPPADGDPHAGDGGVIGHETLILAVGRAPGPVA